MALLVSLAEMCACLKVWKQIRLLGVAGFSLTSLSSLSTSPTSSVLGPKQHAVRRWLIYTYMCSAPGRQMGTQTGTKWKCCLLQMKEGGVQGAEQLNGNAKCLLHEENLDKHKKWTEAWRENQAAVATEAPVQSNNTVTSWNFIILGKYADKLYLWDPTH